MAYQNPQRGRMVYGYPTQQEEEKKEEVSEERKVVISERKAFNNYISKLWYCLIITWSNHWTTTGPNFMEMHKIYEGIYNWLIESIDEIAENLTGNEIQFTIDNSIVSAINNEKDNCSWDDRAKEECKALTSLKSCLADAKKEADKYDLYGLESILDNHAEELDKYMYFIKQTIA